jgi:hypothetical protein
MAGEQTDKPPFTTTATHAESKLTWEWIKDAEDEISILWRQTAKIETSEQASEAARQSQIDFFWPQIEALANFCDEILQKHGFPHAFQLVRHDCAGKWWPHPVDAPRLPPTGETWNLTRGAALSAEYSANFSDAWYAGRIGIRCRLALEHYRKGDAGKPFLFAKIFEIATLRNDWRWRRSHKPSILTGQPVRKGAKLGGEMRAGKLKPETANIIKAMQQLMNSGQSASRAAELVASKGLGKNKEANRALWKRHRER